MWPKTQLISLIGTCIVRKFDINQSISRSYNTNHIKDVNDRHFGHKKIGHVIAFVQSSIDVTQESRAATDGTYEH